MTSGMGYTPYKRASHMEGQILGMGKGFGSVARQMWHVAQAHLKLIMLSKAGLHGAGRLLQQALHQARASPCVCDLVRNVGTALHGATADLAAARQRLAADTGRGCPSRPLLPRGSLGA